MKIYIWILPFKNRILTGGLILILTVLSVLNVVAQVAPLRGKVQMIRSDGANEPVKGVLIEVYRQDLIGKYPSVRTNAGGEFVFAAVPLGGVFKFCASAPGISPACRPNLKAGMENIVINVVKGDGSRPDFEDMEQKIPPRNFPQVEKMRRFEIGVQFSALMRRKPQPLFNSPTIVPDDFDRDNRYGGGLRLTYNLTEHIAVEAEGNFFPKKDEFRDLSVPGGNIIQAHFGVKIGKRYKRFGFFGKARPGFVRFSEASEMTGTRTFTFNNQQFTVGEFAVGKANYFSTDLGGVFEFYPSRRVLARFDIGDTLIRYGAYRRESLIISIPYHERPAETKHNLQFSAGIGFRF